MLRGRTSPSNIAGQTIKYDRLPALAVDLVRRQVGVMAQDDQEAYASEATGHQDRVAQNNARPYRENRRLD
jgi:hypothetical protein